MSEQIAAASEELVRRLAGGLRAAQLYAPSHPIVARQTEGLLAALETLHQHQPNAVIGLVAGQVVVGDLPLPRLAGQMAELIDRLKRAGIERIAIDHRRRWNGSGLAQGPRAGPWPERRGDLRGMAG